MSGARMQRPADPASAGRTRRALLQGALGLGVSIVVRPARAASAPTLESAIRVFASEAPVKVGRVHLDVAPLVENGNAVPITVNVESAMTSDDHVRRIAVFNELNPQRDVAVFTLGPRAGRARVATRVRLATSQRLVAVAQMSDGTYWQHAVDVIVTLAACVES